MATSTLLTKGGPTASPPAEPRRPRRRAFAHWLDFKAAPYTFVAPFFIVFGAFGLYPLVYTGWISLHQVELQTPNQRTWVGFGNYSDLLHDDRFWHALLNTFTIGVISTVPQLLMALGLAHLLNYRLRGSTFFRVAVLTPYATSIAAATLVFSMLFGRDFGMINWFLHHLFGMDNVDWEAGRWTSQIAISTIVTWRWTGYNALIYLAAMQAVPSDLYEAAAIDGASRWQQFRKVTIPSLRPTIVFTIVISTIGATQLFGEPLLFGGTSGARGGINGQYQTLGLLLYQQGWGLFHLGRAAAVAWLMFAILIVIAAVNALINRRLRKS